MSHIILLIHEHASARAFIRHVLLQHDYLVLAAETPDEAVQSLQHEAYNVVPDLILAGGASLPRLLHSPLRQHFPSQRGLPLLAIDDIAGHPVPEGIARAAADPQVLLLHLRRLLHKSREKQDVIEHEGLRIDATRQQAWAGHLQLELTTLTFRLLHLLARQPGRIYSRQQLLDNVWMENGHVDERTVDVHIYRLRNQLSRFGLGHLIESVRGSGYRLAMPQRHRQRLAAGPLRFAS